MTRNTFHVKVGREDLPNIFGGGERPTYIENKLSEALNKSIGKKEIIVGYWREPASSILPDFIAVSDSDFDDTFAWLSAFVANFAPLSQWIRLWTVSELSNALSNVSAPWLDNRLGPWVGAILSEYALGVPNHALKDLSGAGALTTASYCAGRSIAIWGDSAPVDLVGERHERIYGKRASKIGASDLLSIWYVLAGDRWGLKAPSEHRSLDSFRSVFRAAESGSPVEASDLAKIAKSISEELSLPELVGCATETQKNRVVALDKLGEQILKGPITPASSAILGLGASFVDPGASVLPELLRRFNDRLPAAPIWAGAFAGAWYPVRVLCDHGGLGRIVAKEIVRNSDIFEKPRADISFAELERWSGGAFSSQIGIRGLLNRTLFVELFPGVVTPLSVSRTDSPKATEARTSSADRQQSFELEPAARETSIQDRSTLSLKSLSEQVENLEKRLSLVEKNQNGYSKTTTSKGRKK